MKPKVSIIIRSRNEERWITACLKAVSKQRFTDYEIILVDNKSTDKTVEKAVQQFDVKVVEIDEYFPGRALNAGIVESVGQYIVMLSAHCIPRDVHWLENLVKNLEEDPAGEIAGVYGRQEPMSFTSALDKRDLFITFGLDRRVQIKDSFFHNANSMIRRDVWERMPFDNQVTNIEDRIWAQQVIEQGYKIIYEPEASVYHYHGIHQGGDEKRCFNIVRILESLKRTELDLFYEHSSRITAIIPIKGEFLQLDGKPLLDYTLRRAFESEYIDDVIVSTDNPDIAVYARQCGAQVPFLRSKEMFDEFAGLDKVMQHTIEELEKRRHYADIVVVLKETYPFRPIGLIDDMIKEMLRTGVDTLMPTFSEYRSCFKKDEDGRISEIDDGFLPREVKSPIFISLAGLGLVTLPKFIREGRQLGDRVGLFEVKDKHGRMEVRDKDDIDVVTPILKKWWQEGTIGRHRSPIREH